MHKDWPVQTGYLKIDQSHSHEQVSHVSYNISIAINGFVRMIHGEEILIETDYLTLIPAGYPHKQVFASQFELRWLSFCAGCMELDEKQPLMLPFQRVRLGALPTFKLLKEQKRRLFTLFDNIEKECRLVKPETLEVLRSYLVIVLNEIKQIFPIDHRQTKQNAIVEKALHYIQEHCFESISLKSVAKAINYTPTHVANVFKKETGFSVGDWITHNRLAESCSRLVHTDAPIEQIANQIGWSDTTHFIRQFKKVYQVTPAAWRKQNRVFVTDKNS